MGGVGQPERAIQNCVILSDMDAEIAVLEAKLAKARLLNRA